MRYFYKAMLHVFKKCYPNVRMINSGSSEITLIMDFDQKAYSAGNNRNTGNNRNKGQLL